MTGLAVRPPTIDRGPPNVVYERSSVGGGFGYNLAQNLKPPILPRH